MGVAEPMKVAHPLALQHHGGQGRDLHRAGLEGEVHRLVAGLRLRGGGAGQQVQGGDAELSGVPLSFIELHH